MTVLPQPTMPPGAATDPGPVRSVVDADILPVDRPDDVEPEPDSEVGEEDPGAAVDQPPVEPIYPPGTHGH